MKTRLILCLVILSVGFSYLFQSSQIMNDETVEVFSRTILKYGSIGKDVRELQGRLKFLGYYKGAVDGDFGYSTLASVRTFQRRFGMKADGIVGAKTKLKLYNATKRWRPGMETGSGVTSKASTGGTTLRSSPPRGFSAQDLKMMANAVYGEARGEPYIGQVAVAAVILNRVDNPSFPNTPSGVIFQPGAFTAVDDGQIWLTPNKSAMKAVQDALNGWDPSGGCIYYFNPVTATSKWIWTRPQVKRIGKHIFCR
jgi:N-acetylmuramoyl-L-alanine amidase